MLDMYDQGYRVYIQKITNSAGIAMYFYKGFSAMIINPTTRPAAVQVVEFATAFPNNFTYYNVSEMVINDIQTYPMSDGWEAFNVIMNRNNTSYAETLGSMKIE